MGEGGDGWWALVGLVVLLPFVLVMAAMIRSRRRFREWTHTEATVTRLKKVKRRETGPNGGQMVESTELHYRFTDKVGKEWAGVDAWPGKLTRGSVVAVAYDPHNPELNELTTMAPYYRWLAILAVPFLLGAYAFQWGLASWLGADPWIEIPDPRLLWLDEEDIEAG